MRLTAIFRTGDPVDTVWRWAVALSSFLAVVVLALFAAIDHEYDASLARDAARTPIAVYDDAPVRDSDVLGYWTHRFDSADDHEVGIDLFMPTGDPSENPPGVTAWPRPGEVYASPALLAAPGGIELIDRYGTLVGTIDQDVLADRAEMTLYVGVDPQLAEPTAVWWPVTGFGLDVNPANGDTGYFGSALYHSHRGAGFLLVLVFALAPLLVLVIVLSRLGGERRDATVSLLTALGVARAQVSGALWRAVRLPLLSGTGVGGALVLALECTSWTVPYTGYPMAPSPDARLVAAVAMCCIMGAALTWAALWIGIRPRRSVFASPRPVAAARRSTTRPIWLLLGVLTGANWLYSLVVLGNPNFGAVVLFVGVVLSMLLLGPATARVLQAIAGGIVGLSRRQGGPTALVIGRELSVMARSAVRATVFMGVVALTATFATLVASQPVPLVQQARAASEIADGRALGITTADEAAWLPQLAESLPADEHLVELVQGLGIEGVQLTATCATQEALLGDCVDGAQGTIGSVTADVPDALRAWGATTSTVVTTAKPAAGLVLVVSDNETPVNAASLADEMRGLVSPGPLISEPGAQWIVGAQVGLRQTRWITAAAALAVVLAMLMGAATLFAEVVRMRRRHQLFTAHAGTFSRHLGLGAGLVGLPLALGGALGATTGLLASWSAVRLGNASAASTGSLLGTLLIVTAVVAACSSVVAALATGTRRLG